MAKVQEMIHENGLPGHESRLDPKPEWQPRYRGSDRLMGRVAIITGADSGIGRAVAALYAREGADIVIVYLLEDDAADETKRIVEAEGRRAITIKADVGSRKMCDRIAAQAMEAFGRWAAWGSRTRWRPASCSWPARMQATCRARCCTPMAVPSSMAEGEGEG